jgi:hypothetical protein
MLYVLASDTGGLYYYRPGDDRISGSVGRTGPDWNDGREPELRPAGTHLLVFERAVDAFQLRYFLEEPGETVAPRRAQSADKLGDTVCYVHHGGGTPNGFVYTLRPTPADAIV